MDQKSWDKWREHPQTVEFFKFLDDYRSEVGREVALHVTDGEIPPQEFIVREAATCGVYLELAELNFPAIEAFYAEEAAATAGGVNEQSVD